MSLSRCIKKLGVSAHEAAIYKAVFDDYRNDGIEPMLAARKAVQERLDELLGERANVIKQIGEAGGSVPGAAQNKGTAPEHEMVGVDKRELKKIVGEFNDAQRSAINDGDKVTHIFDAPKKGEIVNLEKKAGITARNVDGKRVYNREGGWMTVEEAKAHIEKWKAHTKKQGKTGANADRIVLSLFDLTGKWSQPWEDAGYQVYRFDIQDDWTYQDEDPETGDVIEKRAGDVHNFSSDFFDQMFGHFDGNDVYAILAACPCTDFAVSGARHFAAKDADGRTVASVSLVHQTLATIEYFKPAVWALENPVGRIEELGGLPPWRLSFDPNHLGDPYTKKTLIWGRFNADLPIAPVEPTEGSKMHSQYGGKSMATKNARSATPEGFAYGFFMANNAIDNPVMAVANKYDRLDRNLIKQAIESGVTEQQISEAVDDFYYQDLDDVGANAAIRELIKPDGLELEGQTIEQGKAAAKAADDKAKADAKAKAAADEKDRQDRIRKEVAQRSEAAADNFQLGQSGEDNLSGQGGLFGGAETVAPQGSPSTDKPSSPEELKAKADLMAGLADLADIFGKNTKLYLTPEQEQKLLPVLTKIFDAAFRLGHVKFKAAAKYVLDQIRAMLGDDVAKAINLDHLQGAYISMASGKQGADTKRAVIDVETLAEIDAPAVDPVVAKYPSVEGTEIHVVKNQQGHAVSMFDTDIGQYLPTLRMFKGDDSLEQAKMYAADLQAKSGVENGGEQAQNAPKEPGNVSNRDTNLERDSGNAAAAGDAMGRPDGAGRQGADKGTRQPGRKPGLAGSAGQGDSLVSNGGATPPRKRGDIPVYPGETESLFADLPPGIDESERGDPVGQPGVRTDAGRAGTAGVATRPAEQADKRRAQLDARGVKIIPADAGNIAESLPYLKDGQRDDVAFAERRFAKPDGHGVLFTNGTGTGKTYTGLGIAYRFERQGKSNIAIIAPQDKVIDDWIASGKNLGLDIKKLDGTKDNGGSGIVITTYENFSQNDALANRKWDLVLADESHKLMQNAAGDETGFIEAFRALTMHPRGASDLAVRKYRKEYDASKQADADYIAARKAKAPDTPRLERISEEKSRAWTAKLKLVQEEVAAAQKGGRSKAVFLSATPWAYEKNVDYAEGYLFDYPKVDDDSYNAGNPFQRFMMTHFGYRMRYNKLTEPGPEVDRGLMQRQFNTWLKREGALSGRSLDVPFDYDRKFVLIDSSIGRRIDEALEWFWQRDGLSQAESRARGALYDKVKEHFDYLHRRFLLEALKAEAVVPLIKQNLELGRKVVVFHDYKKGGGFHPFHISIAKGEEVGYYDPSAKGEQPKAMLQPVWDQFKTEFADLMAYPFHRMKSPIEAIKTAFPEAGIFNGSVPKKARIDAVNRFQADDSPYNVVLIQSAAGKEGISAHDTSGKHQRVLYNLGLPTQPTTAIQQEGRIFRTGQASNAMMRYLNTGTSWERDAFANTISRRASTAENLAMGEGARGLLDSFINAFESSDTYPPGHEGEGTGGKEMDRALQQALSEFDRAKTFYFGQQKKTSRTKAQEGADYFATPEPLALKMVEWASVQKGDSVLEPSAGHGAIARWFPDNVKRRAIEPSGELASRLALVFDGEIERGSFEEHHIVNKYDAIVMNPPFGSSSKTAFDHIEKAWQHLREGGRLVALFPQGPAADKRLDKFLNEGVKKEAKLLFTHATLGPINRGDTAIIDAFGRQQKMVVWDVHQETPTGAAYVMPKGADLSSAINLVAVTRIERPDTQAKELPEKVAEILLPSVTFERAGTSVAARVLVVQKGGFDEQPISRDYRDIDTIKEFFDRIEHFDLTARPERAEPEAAAPAKTAKAAPDAKPAGTTPTGGLFESFEQKHSRTGETMYMAGYAKRVSTEDYRAADSVARKHGGHYSRYENKAQGIKKGFAFPDAEKRQAFLNEAGQSQGGNAGDAPVFSRRKIDSTNPLIQAWNDIAQSDDAFRYGETEAKGLPEIVAAVDPALKVQESKEHSSAVERMFYITEKGGGGVILKDYGDKVELDASPLKQGQGGNRFYYIAAMYALNNGKVFDGDRVGVSAIAVRRRVENLLSSALRFGTTRHLSPGPEVETGTVSEDFGEKRRLPVRALSWKPGDDAHNLHELLITSMENVQKAVPQIKDVRYNFSNRTFENADGTEFTDADFDALASSGDARAAAAGSGTLKRTVVSQSVLQGARRQGSGLLDESGAGNAAAADPLGRALREILYKRTQAPLLAGLSVSGAQNHVAGYKWKNGPAINVLANPADAPFAAPADAVGAFWGGKVWVFASNVSNTAELNFAVFHEALGHYGLRGAFGASRALDNALQHLWVANRKVRAEASKWTQRYGKDALKARLDAGMTENEAKRTVHFLAIEEALADRAAAGDTFKGIQKLMAALQDALRAVGLDTVADWLEGMSNAEASRMLDIARQFVEKGATNIATVERLAAVYQRKAPVWTSALSDKIAEVKNDTLPAGQWKAVITNMSTKGVKPEEISWSGVLEWLDTQGGRVSKAQILDYLAQNGVQVEETMLGDKDAPNPIQALDDLVVRADALGYVFSRERFNDGDEDFGRPVEFWRRSDGKFFEFVAEDGYLSEIDGEETITDGPIAQIANSINDLALEEQEGADIDGTRYSNWQLPGGENYRELLLTLPEKVQARTPDAIMQDLQERGYGAYEDGGVWWLSDANDDPVTRTSAPSEVQRIMQELDGAGDAITTKNPASFHSAHFDPPNILSHIRFNERTDADGKRVLFIEEIQSDWAQKGKKEGFKKSDPTEAELRQLLDEAGYDTNFNGTNWVVFSKDKDGLVPNKLAGGSPQKNQFAGNLAQVTQMVLGRQDLRSGFQAVPSAPFVGKTEAWVGLSLKRMIRYAAENGFDRVAFTTGEQQAARYDLSKQVGNVQLIATGADGALGKNSIINASRPDGSHALSRTVSSESEIADLIGKEAAKRLLEKHPMEGFGRNKGSTVRVLEGLDLKIGGEGMKAFYDKIVPNVANDVLKKLGGGRVEVVTLSTDGMTDGQFEKLPISSIDEGGNMKQPGFDITPELRAKAMQGLPLFGRMADQLKGMNKGAADGLFNGDPALDDIGGGNLLAAYDDAELKAKTDREAAAAKAEAEAAKAPASKKVTAHQDSLFEGQIALFSRTIEKGQESLARRVINRVDAALDPIGSLPGHKEYLAERYRTLGRLARVDDIAKEIHKAFGSASDADAAAAYDYLTTADADPTTIRDEEVRAGAVRVKNLLGSIGDALVQRGMLSEESREEYRDRYLPRLYLKHLLGDSVFSALAGGKKPSDMGYLKARKDIPEDVRKVILGEIEDPGFLSAIGVAKPMRDMALLDWLARMSRNQDWVYPQSLVEYKNAPATVRFLLAEALRLRQQAAHMKPELAERARQEADAMEAAANTGDDNDPPNPADYKRIPDTARYGRMRGLWVRKEIYDDLMGVHDFLPTDPGWFQSVFGYGGIGTKVTQLWKMSKVALNPPGQVRNFVSNAVMLQLSGVPLLRLPDTMIRAGLEIVRNGEAFQTAKRYGVTAASFSSQEMGRIETELLRVQAQKGFHPLRRMQLVFGAIANGAGDLYQFTESMFKTAKIMHELENGRDEAAAALEAHKWMFDYSLVPKSVRYARNAPIGVPFITYVYKVLPRLLEVAMFHPHRFLPWVALAYGLPAMAAASLGVGGDDLEKLKKALPEWLQKRGFAYFLPFKDDGGRMQAVDLGYFFPWSQWTEIAHSFARGNVNDAMQSAGLFSGPITDILVAVKTGIDPFTKRPIMNKADPAERQALDLLNYVYNMAAPPFITSNGVLSPMGLIDPMYGGKAVQAATGTTNRFGDPRATGQQAALALLGVNMYAIDPEHTRAQNVMRMQRELQDVEGRAKQLLTDRGLTAERKAEIVKDYTAESKRRAQELAKYLRESQVHPNLRKAP